MSITDLTLVIPAYNRADLIGETIDAALNQSVPFSEIIVVNDGSTDDTMNVLKRYGDLIRVIHTINQGVQAARNTGVNTASTSYVTLCDSDDVLDCDYVKMIVQWISSNVEHDIIYSNFVTFDEKSVSGDKFSAAPHDYFSDAKTSPDFIYDIPDIYLRTLVFQPLFCSGVTFRKVFYQRIGGFNPALKGIGSEDWEFTLRAISNTAVVLSRHPLVRIRKHTANDSANSTRQAVGEAEVLTYALEHHPKALQYQPAILDAIESIRFVAFERAFARAEFDTAKKMANLLRHKPLSVKFWIKCAIVFLPTPLRIALWKTVT